MTTVMSVLPIWGVSYRRVEVSSNH